MKAKPLAWRPSSAVVVTATAAIVITAVVTLNWFNGQRTRVNAHVEIAAPQFASAPVQRANAAAPGSVLDGEIERLALRVREVSALMLGLTATAANHQLQRHPIHDVENLIATLTSAAPLPPGLERVPGQGALVSAHALLYVRYRPQPFGLEIVSIGRESLDGPAVLSRMDAGPQPGAWLFIARRIAGTTIPAPFAPLEEVIALHWQSEPLRERAAATPELAQLETWARHYAITNP